MQPLLAACLFSDGNVSYNGGCITVALCVQQSMAVSLDNTTCVTPLTAACPVTIRVANVAYCSCSGFVASDWSCADSCNGMMFTQNQLNKYCLAQGATTCLAGQTCQCASGEVANSSTQCACDPSVGFYNSLVQPQQFCKLCTTFLSLDNQSCVAACPGFLFSVKSTFKQCCTGSYCSCNATFTNLDGVCGCAELFDEKTTSCITRQKCIEDGRLALGQFCQTPDNCKYDSQNLACLSEQTFIQCGAFPNIQTCQAKYGCAGNACAFFSAQADCLKACAITCVQQSISFLQSKLSGAFWFSEQSQVAWVCQSYQNATTIQIQSTICKKTIKYGNQELIATQRCPSTIGCANNVPAHLMAYGSKWTNFCAAATVYAECNQFCKVNCVENWAAGVYSATLMDAKGTIKASMVAPLQPYQCPKGKERRALLLTGGETVAICIGSVLGAAAVAALVVLIARKTSWRLNGACWEKVRQKCCARPKKTAESPRAQASPKNVSLTGSAMRVQSLL